ncbi:MAG TPA: DUF2185 domain-containing protein [Sphingomicrobium sp.]
MRLPRPIDRMWRRSFGTFEIDDPRPIAAEARYTFFLPTDEQLAAIQPGDEVKLIIRSVPPSSEWDAERMWVDVKEAHGDLLSGALDNDPLDIPQLKAGHPLQFPRSAIIDILWAENRTEAPPPGRNEREYWERCMVDDCVLGGRSPVDYLYREEPDLAQPDDKYPDSGWRIRGTDDGIAEDEATGRSPQYVAIGAVLNRDDSWLHLIDSPEGSRFVRDPHSGEFVACEDQ